MVPCVVLTVKSLLQCTEVYHSFSPIASCMRRTYYSKEESGGYRGGTLRTHTTPQTRPSHSQIYPEQSHFGCLSGLEL